MSASIAPLSSMACGHSPGPSAPWPLRQGLAVPRAQGMGRRPRQALVLATACHRAALVWALTCDSPPCSRSAACAGSWSWSCSHLRCPHRAAARQSLSSEPLPARLFGSRRWSRSAGGAQGRSSLRHRRSAGALILAFACDGLPHSTRCFERLLLKGC